VRCEQSCSEAFSRLAIAVLLHEHINDFSILIDGPPQIVLYAVNYDKYFIEIERITKSMVTVLQAPSVCRAKFVAVKPSRLITDDNTSLR
jgi:hypothetical protein